MNIEDVISWKKSNNSIFFRCQAEVAITNLSRCNLGEDACNLSCTTTGHASGKCEEEEVNLILPRNYIFIKKNDCNYITRYFFPEW